MVQAPARAAIQNGASRGFRQSQKYVDESPPLGDRQEVDAEPHGIPPVPARQQGRAEELEVQRVERISRRRRFRPNQNPEVSSRQKSIKKRAARVFLVDRVRAPLAPRTRASRGGTKTMPTGLVPSAMPAASPPRTSAAVPAAPWNSSRKKETAIM